jgi:hypothetical protein
MIRFSARGEKNEKMAGKMVDRLNLKWHNLFALETKGKRK